MSHTQAALLVAGMALVTFAIRYPALALVGRIRLPRGIRAALQFVPVAVLTALIVPALVLSDGAVNLRPENAYLVGGLVAVVVARRTSSLLWTISIGLAVFFAWRVLIGGG